MKRVLLALAGSALLSLGAVPAASAATVELSKQEFCDCDGLGGNKGVVFTLTYRAEPNELNTATLTWEDGTSSYRVRETTAPLTAGGGCQASGPSEVVCVAVDTCQSSPAFTCASRWNVIAEMGDRNDVVTSEGLRAGSTDAASVQLAGGDGDDRVSARGTTRAILLGGPGHDLLQGGDGNDSLLGGAGPDDLGGGPGNDLLYGDRADLSPVDPAAAPVAPAADVIDGGPGSDQVSYFDRTGPVVVDLTSGAGVGAAGEGDTLFSIENVEGGMGNDTLNGDDGPNRLVGLDGTDVLAGRGGDDYLDGWAGADELRGGPGDDLLAPDGIGGGSPPAESDLVDGGPDEDMLTFDGRPGGVVVDLSDDKPDGEPSAPDRLSAVEDVTGSAGNDFIRGDSADNVLSGAWGRDRVYGLAGDDVVMAEPADQMADVLSAGSGDDVIAGTGRRPSCGKGRDVVEGLVGRSLAVRGCESLWALPHLYDRSEIPPPAPILELGVKPRRVTSKAVLLRAYCPQRKCSAPITIRAGSRTIASGRVAMKRGQRGDLRIPLTSAGRRLLSRVRAAEVTVQVGAAADPPPDRIPMRLTR